MKLSVLLLPLVLLAACAAGQPQGSAAAPDATASQPGSDVRIAQAAITPLGDLNVVRGQIPPVLSAAQQSPYAVPVDVSCGALATEILALDATLGADLDTPATAANPGLIERGSEAAGNAVVGAVQKSAEGVMPFRGWVRKLTGADRYAREVAAAIAAGSIRRAYLKGLGQSAGCPAPAAPRR